MNAKLIEIFSDIYDLKPSEVTLDLDIARVPAWDSMNNLRFVTAVEEEFGIELSMEEIQEMTTMPAIIEILAAKGVT